MAPPCLHGRPMTFEHSTLAALAHRYDAFLVDQFGVLLDGPGAYPFAAAALSTLASTGKPLILLSNSGRRSAPNEARLVSLGFARDSFRTVFSSGEAAHACLARRIGTTLAAGTKVWLHARDGDRSAIEGLDLTETDEPARAGLILIAGSLADRITMDEYRQMLAPAAQAGVPCLCTNPDVTMMTASGLRPGAGAIARLFSDLGGAVEQIGKPFPLIYEEVRALLPGIPASRILTIGDSPAHDVAGGQGAGMATALVRTGIHADLSDVALLDLCRAEGHVPDHVIPRFSFEEA